MASPSGFEDLQSKSTEIRWTLRYMPGLHATSALGLFKTSEMWEKNVGVRKLLVHASKGHHQPRYPPSLAVGAIFANPPVTTDSLRTLPFRSMASRRDLGRFSHILEPLR